MDSFNQAFDTFNQFGKDYWGVPIAFLMLVVAINLALTVFDTIDAVVTRIYIVLITEYRLRRDLKRMNKTNVRIPVGNSEYEQMSPGHYRKIDTSNLNPKALLAMSQARTAGRTDLGNSGSITPTADPGRNGFSQN